MQEAHNKARALAQTKTRTRTEQRTQAQLAKKTYKDRRTTCNVKSFTFKSTTGRLTSTICRKVTEKH